MRLIRDRSGSGPNGDGSAGFRPPGKTTVMDGARASRGDTPPDVIGSGDQPPGAGDGAATPRTGGAPPRALASFSRGFYALRNRNYRLYWAGQLISNTGTWMQSTAQAWLVLQLTNSPFAIGLVATFQF